MLLLIYILVAMAVQFAIVYYIGIAILKKSIKDLDNIDTGQNICRFIGICLILFSLIISIIMYFTWEDLDDKWMLSLLPIWTISLTVTCRMIFIKFKKMKLEPTPSGNPAPPSS